MSKRSESGKGPSQYLVKLSQKLFSMNSDAAARFVEAFDGVPNDSDSTVMLLKDCRVPIEIKPRQAWQPPWVIHGKTTEQLGRHQCHEEGNIYLLDLSSVFAASILQAIDGSIHTCLDLCASPGGKGIFAWKLLAPHMLIANEVVQKRIPPLISNLKRCTVAPSKVTSRDPSFFAAHFPQSSDLVLVDAPCSGQSLLLKGEGNASAFHPALINKNSNRQKHIVWNASEVVKRGGYLAYMTCTFSIEENEKIVEWFLKKREDFEAVPFETFFSFQSLLTDIPCYRLFPYQGFGAGAFTALFKRKGSLQMANSSIEDVQGIYTL